LRLKEEWKNGQVQSIEEWAADGRRVLTVECTLEEGPGKCEGVATWWFQGGGKAAEGRVVDGRRVGKWSEWGRDGSALEERDYDSDPTVYELHAWGSRSGLRPDLVTSMFGELAPSEVTCPVVGGMMWALAFEEEPPSIGREGNYLLRVSDVAHLEPADLRARLDSIRRGSFGSSLELDSDDKIVSTREGVPESEWTSLILVVEPKTPWKSVELVSRVAMAAGLLPSALVKNEEESVTLLGPGQEPYIAALRVIPLAVEAHRVPAEIGGLAGIVRDPPTRDWATRRVVVEEGFAWREVVGRVDQRGDPCSADESHRMEIVSKD
jgi:hypothetical protein